jgi:hypothetical protein
MTNRSSMKLPTQVFFSVISDHQANQSGQLNLNDVMFLDKKNTSPNNLQFLSIGSFFSDFR